MDQYKVIIQYHTGRRRGQIITIKGIEDQKIMEILGEITQDQLANASVQIFIGDEIFDYFDFLFKHYQTSIQRGDKLSN